MKRVIGHSIRKNRDRDKDEQDEMERILSHQQENEILPSSGFTASVMDAVRREASAPAPIPFPWTRVLPGMAVAAVALVTIIVALVRAVGNSSEATTTAQLSMLAPTRMPSMFQGGVESAAIWTVLSLLVALVSVKISMRMASGRA